MLAAHDAALALLDFKIRSLKSVLCHRRVNVLAVRLTTSEARKMIKNDVAEDPESGIRCSAQLQNPAPLARSRSCVTRSSFAGPTSEIEGGSESRLEPHQENPTNQIQPTN